MPGPAPRPRYPRATAQIRAAHFPRKLLRRGESTPPQPPGEARGLLLAENGNRLLTESNLYLRTEQD